MKEIFLKKSGLLTDRRFRSRLLLHRFPIGREVDVCGASGSSL